MAATFKELTNFFIAEGADKVPHTETVYLAHGIGVYNDLKKWGCDEDVCRAGLFHSIYGTELFRGFMLPLERRDEVRQLIGERAERLAYINCAMDRSSLDAAVARGTPPYIIRDRITGDDIELSEAELDDLCTIHLCDWLEQNPRAKAWDYRPDQYGNMALRLGGVALESFRRVLGECGVELPAAVAHSA